MISGGELTACWACAGTAVAAPGYTTTGYWRCASCGLLFRPDRASAADEAAIYDDGYFAEYPGGEAYEDDARQRRFEASRRIPFVVRHAGGGRLLEIGAASGHFVHAAQHAGYDAIGVEPAAGLAELGRRQLGVDVRAGTLQELDPAVDGQFDVVCAWHVLEHLPEPLEAMAQLHALLRPGGLLCLEVPNIDSMLSRRDQEAWFHLDAPHHVAHYGPGSLRALLHAGGFTDLETTTLSALSYLRPGRTLHPRGVVALAKEARAVRMPRWRLHPDRHELLRAAARRPA